MEETTTELSLLGFGVYVAVYSFGFSSFIILSAFILKALKSLRKNWERK